MGCQSGCITCSRDDQSKCLECYRPLYLFNSKCIAQCPKGYRPSFLGDTCVVESDVPVVYFPLMILTLLAAVISWAGQYSSRLTNPDLHKKLLTFYALTGLIDVIAMWFQLIISIFFILVRAVKVRTEGAAPTDPHQYKLQTPIWTVAVPIISLGAQYFLNYRQMKLWDRLDPPKPKDENQGLERKEVERINDCDEHFDVWNEKYFAVAKVVRTLVGFVSHKFFMMPYTHFYGYLHCTVRVQDDMKRWQWDPHEILKLKRGRITQAELRKEFRDKDEPENDELAHGFRYKGRLVPARSDDPVRDAWDPVAAGGQGAFRYENGKLGKSAVIAADGKEDGYWDKEGGSLEMEGGGKKEGMFDDKTPINPFDFVQSSKAEGHKRYDTRIFDAFQKQMRIDFIFSRLVLLVGNAAIIFVALDGQALNQMFIQCAECMFLSLIMMYLQQNILRNWEDHKLPFKMKDQKANFLFKQMRAPNDVVNLDLENEEERFPLWDKYAALYKFPEIYLDNKLEELLNIFGRR